MVFAAWLWVHTAGRSVIWQLIAPAAAFHLTSSPGLRRRLAAYFKLGHCEIDKEGKMEKVTVEIDAKWVRRINSPSFYYYCVKRAGIFPSNMLN